MPWIEIGIMVSPEFSPVWFEQRSATAAGECFVVARPIVWGGGSQQVSPYNATTPLVYTSCTV